MARGSPLLSAPSREAVLITSYVFALLNSEVSLARLHCCCKNILLAFMSLLFLATLSLSLRSAASANSSSALATRKAFPFPEFQKVLKISSPDISPDGEKLVYLSNEGGYPSVWMDTIPPSAPQKILDISKPISGVQWHPNGKWLVYVADNNGDENDQVAFFDLATKKSTMITRNPKRRYFLCGFSNDESLLSYSTNERDERFFDIFSMSASGEGEPKLLVKSDKTNMCGGGFSPDNAKYSFTVFHENNHQDSLVLDVKSGVVSEITKSGDSSRNHPLAWSLDGRFLFQFTDASSNFWHLVKTDVANGSEAKMFDHPWDIAAGGVSKRGEASFYKTNENGIHVLHFFKGEFQTPFSVQIPKGVLSSVSFSSDGKRLIYSFSNGTTPTRFFVYDLASAQSTLVLDSNRSSIPKSQFVDGEQVIPVPEINTVN